MKKKIALLMACVMAFGIAVGGTLAWLTDKTGDVVNTFTPSTINITLTEEKPADKTAKMIPGFTIEKDPKVTVAANSEDCYLFVKVTESANYDDFMTYAVDNTIWTELTGVEGVTGVYYRKVTDSAADQSFNVLAGNKVTVKDTVTKGMMTENFTQPTLAFKAAAIQLFSTNGTEFDVSVAYKNLPDEFKA